MSAITGEVAAKLKGKIYRLYLGMRGIGILQQEFGADLAPILKAAGGASEEEGSEAVPDTLPDMRALLRVIEVSLMRFHPDPDPYLADDLLGEDIGLPAKLIVAAVPAAGDVPTGKSGRSTKAAPSGKRKAGR